MTDSPGPVDCGPWALDPELLVLRIEGDWYSYEVDLEECVDSAEILDTIIQIARKKWATDAVIGGLVRAINWTLDPQAHLCSFGRSTTISSGKVREIVNARRGHALHRGGAV